MPTSGKSLNQQLLDLIVKECRLLPNSAKALKAGFQLGGIDGIGGALSVKIPEKMGAPLEVICTVGKVEIVLR